MSWKLKLSMEVDAPRKFLDAGEIHPRFKIYDRNWIDSVLNIRRYDKQKVISVVRSPDGRTFKDYVFFVVEGRKDPDTDEICCSEKEEFNVLPGTVAVLCMLSEDDQVGVVGLYDKRFHEVCVKNPELLKLFVKLVREKPKVWKNLRILLPRKGLPR